MEQQAEAVREPGTMVREFRQILVWPVQLAPIYGTPGAGSHWERLLGADGPWREVSDEFTDDPRDFQERHYCEFVAFMPDVQRFLYGEGAKGHEPSAIRVFRRRDVTSARVTLRSGTVPLTLDVARVELYFFYDIDLAILAVEVAGRELTLDQAQELQFRFGRAYPKAWDADGHGAHCCAEVALLAADGAVLARSDYPHKADYLVHVCAQRTPRVASHWAYLLEPLVPQHSDTPGDIRYTLLEHQRIPLLTYLAVDDPYAIARDDWMRLGLASPPGASGTAPYAAGFLDDFEARHCYDRFWDARRQHDQTATRIICTGHAFVMVGEAGNPVFTDGENGILAQFRHQYFILGLIAHFHRAALLIFRDRLVTAITQLRDYSGDTVKRFKREVRLSHENFLRFTHRYWFQDVSSQPAAQELFALWVAHLKTDRLFAEVRAEVQDMIDYLDSDGLRRQANSVVRLTVVTFFGLIGTVATGFLGMNLIDLTQATLLTKLVALIAVLIPVALLTFYTAAKSRRLAEFLEAMSDERRSLRHKWRTLLRVWRR